MKKTLLNLLSMIVITFAAIVTSSANLSGVGGTLQNTDTAIHSAIDKAESMFEEYRGNHLNNPYNLVKNNKNPYIKTLKIDKDYRILLQFDGVDKKADRRYKQGKRHYTTPVAKALLLKQIVLIPVYNKNDEKITSWECITNADRNIQEMVGSAGAKEFTASFIRDKTDNKYLSLCIFINQDNLF